MRRTAGVILLGTALLAGCSDDPGGPVELAVTIPPPSATAAAPTAPTATAPTGSGPAGSGPAGSGPAGSGPGTGAAAPVPPAAGPQAAYAALVADWQRARSAFFAAVSDGSPRTVAQQRALAAAFLAGQRRFGTGVRAYTWPAEARAAVAVLLQRNAGQQATVAAMAAAGTAAEFTGRLADYGVAAAAENRAVAAVAAALN